MAVLPSEDARIVATRTTLELVWNAQLTAGQQDAWRARWNIAPPRDIAGRIYVARPAQSFGEVEVTEPTQYAWSQIHGVLRYGLTAVASPSPITSPIITATFVTLTTTQIVANITTNTDPQTGLRLLTWATQPHYLTRNAPRWLLRPIAAYTNATSPADFDATAAYTQRWTLTTNRAVTIALGLVNDNNELAGCSTPVTQTVV